MRRLLILQLLFTVSLLHAQAPRQLRKLVELKMPVTSGDNGGTVAINLKNRFYYATIAGNKTSSLAFFNGAGEMVSPPDLAVMFDARGLWYNPVLKTFQGNAFGNGGWFTYVMDEAGIPYDARQQFAGQLQPAPQSVAAYHQRENLVFFLKGSTVVAYDAATGRQLPERTVLLKPGFARKSPPPAGWKVDSTQLPSGYNTTTIVFTGIANAEFGLLNTQTKEIELYGRADGLLAQKLKLPADAPVKDRLNFAFCNNIYWIFDRGTRSWIGYR